MEPAYEWTRRDTIPHERLKEMVRARVSDGVINRIIEKWLNAGVTGGKRMVPEKPTQANEGTTGEIVRKTHRP
jgi:hypothetical protein